MDAFDVSAEMFASERQHWTKKRNAMAGKVTTKKENAESHSSGQIRVLGLLADVWILTVLLGFILIRILESGAFHHILRMLQRGAAR